MANQANDETSIPRSRMRERVPLFRAIGRVDDGLYAVERVLVTAFLVIMTMASFLKILADFLGKGDSVAIYPAIFFAFFIIGRVAAGANPTFKDQRKKQNVMAVLWGVLATAYVWFVHASTLSLTTLQRRQDDGVIAAWSYDWLIAKISSGTVIALHVTVVITMLLYYEFRRPQLGSDSTDNESSSTGLSAGRVARVTLIVATWAGFVFLSTKVGSGYSWAPQLSLVLLLWMAFMGASMATYARKHLTIDAIRKVVPTRFERAFNALSNLTAAVVTAAFFLLSYHYLLKRMGDVPEPGNIPDWVKVASIPLAFALITIRFAAYAIAEAVGAFLKVEPDPVVGLLEEMTE